MKKLITVTYGSHLYGTNNENSDKDYKVVYLPDLYDVLIGEKIKNKFISTSDSLSKNSKDDVDVEYIPFSKFVLDFYEGQTYALEMAFALDSEHPGVTVHDNDMYGVVGLLCSNYLTSSIDSMVGFAISQSYKYGIKGRRYKSVANVYSLLCASNEKDVVSTIFDMVEQDDYVTVKDGNLVVVDKVHLGNTSIAEVKDRVKKMVIKFGDRTKETTENKVDWKSVSHAVRICGMCINLLKHGELFFPLDKKEIKLLKDIKSGNKEWSEVEKIINTRQDIISELKRETNLPPKSDERLADLKDQLYYWLSRLYKININRL